MSDDYSRKSLLLNKNSLQKLYRVKTQHRLQDESTQFINTTSIVSAPKLTLILTLITLSLTTLHLSNTTHWPHIKSLTNYFSYYILQQTQLSIYDRGDNVDETYIEITTYEDMVAHFGNLVAFVDNYTVNGFVEFWGQEDRKDNVDMEYYYGNGTVRKEQVGFQRFKEMILGGDLRDLLLGLRVLYFQIEFGYNRFVDQFKLVFDYEIYSYSMLRLDMSTKYKPKQYDGIMKQQFLLRNLQRVIAGIIMILYSIQARKIYVSETLPKQFRKNSLYWCISLLSLNFISILSTQLAPTCSIMQLLPIFQNYDSSNSSAYNFNTNLRYALPIVFRIIIPVYMILSGFILYSMLMYPGEYFDDYVTGFFSYFYNNFQYGIYEIFVEIRSRGNVAYLLYVILYFYMVLVGSNLIPAFFCTLILQKMAEQELLRYVESQLEFVACPKCKQECYQRDNYGLQININSPKSPYLRSGTKLKHTHDKSQKIAKMYIEQSEGQIRSPLLSPIETIKTKHKRARELSAEFKDLIDESFPIATQFWLRDQLTKISQELQQF